MHKALLDLDNQLHEIEVQEGETLYDACERQGFQLPHGCLSGSCGSCRCEVLEGLEKMKSMDAIESNTIEAIYQNYEDLGLGAKLKKVSLRLSCRAKIEGEVSFKPFKLKR